MVFLLISFSTLSKSILLEFFSTSQKIGFALHCKIEEAVEIQLNEVTITSSFSFISRALKAMYNPSEHVFTVTEYFRLTKFLILH